MTYSNIAPGTQNLVFLGGLMNVKPEWMDGLTENFREQKADFQKIWESEGGNSDDLNFVIGFNSQKSVDLTNEARRERKTGEGDIVLHMNERERIEAFEKMAADIGAAGVIMLNEEKLGELFVDYAAEGEPFVGIAKRGYSGSDADDLPTCEGMKWIAQNGGLALTLPAWEGVPTPATASTHKT